jgi:two-component system LytT family sensor kinase
MKEPNFLFFTVVVAVCLAMAVAGLFFLSRFRTLFRGRIRNELLRQNVVVWLIVFCLIIAVAPMNVELFYLLIREGILYTICVEMISATVNVLFVFNIVRLVAQSESLKKLGFTRHRVLILLTLITATVIFNLPLNYIGNDFSTKHMKFSVLWSIYMASVTGLVYFIMTNIDAERGRQLKEKELELSRMNELKIKAELDALHSKVNPHFLYNALNSIADLSITDGKKARSMTIALADLFRYSINYSQNNFTTVNEEVAMIEVYLHIEKIRFEDQLNYSIKVDPDTGHYLIPRFILQPLVENAVKHGLKITGKMSEIFLEVRKEAERIVLVIADNGPPFPAELSPGYGVKSVFDKLDLLFPKSYEIHFTNHPRKQVSIYINKLVKNDTAL